MSDVRFFAPQSFRHLLSTGLVLPTFQAVRGNTGSNIQEDNAQLGINKCNARDRLPFIFPAETTVPAEPTPSQGEDEHRRRARADHGRALLHGLRRQGGTGRTNSSGEGKGAFATIFVLSRRRKNKKKKLSLAACRTTSENVKPDPRFRRCLRSLVLVPAGPRSRIPRLQASGRLPRDREEREGGVCQGEKIKSGHIRRYNAELHSWLHLRGSTYTGPRLVASRAPYVTQDNPPPRDRTSKLDYSALQGVSAPNKVAFETSRRRHVFRERVVCWYGGSFFVRFSCVTYGMRYVPATQA